MQRREAIKNIAQYMGLACIGGLAWSAYARAHPVSALYPPGARENFTQTCIRCGLCVEACPYSTLYLSGSKHEDDAPLGVPVFSPRQVPCFMCADIPCARACPTGALDLKSLAHDPNTLPRKITNSTEAKNLLNAAKMQMGVAVLDTQNCLAYMRLRCDVCYRVCPLIDKAITLEYKNNQRTGTHAFLLPIVHNDACTGCGKCERACVTEVASIKVHRRKEILGRVNTSYIKGWDSQDERRLEGAKPQQKKQDFSLDYLNSGDL